MNFEDITNLIKTILLILSLPITFIQLRKTSFDKAQGIIEEISKVVLFRLYSQHFISRDEIKAIIKSKSLSAKISGKSVLVDNVLDRITEKVEDSPFFSRKDRRKIFESIRRLREGKYSIHLQISQFVKNYEKQIIITSISFTIAVLSLFPSQFKVTNTDFINRELVTSIGTGILIILATIIAFFIFNKLLFPKTNWGIVKIPIRAFELLPNFYNERITFKSETEKLVFKLTDASFQENKELVETNPGCLYWGISKYYKKHQKYIITFSNKENLFNMQLELYTQSFVNGGIDVAFVTYSLWKNNEPAIKIELPLLDNSTNDSSFRDKLESSLKKLIVSSDNKTLKLQEGSEAILIDKQFRLHGICINNQIFMLKSQDF